ncbi:MAG: site-specific integrase [Bacteroidota bacterium]|nr:site-specific integrase [Bacteroidota bacterium]MDP3144277.1 site-specific integrase [Bacteroidota bacterium]
MKQTSINLPKVIYRTDQPKKDGSNSFYLQLHHNKVKKFISLKVSCTKDFYDEKNNRIKKSHPFSEQYNLIIETQLFKASKIILDARIKDEPITINQFLEKYLGKASDNNKMNFYSFVESEIEVEKKRANKAPLTIKKYTYQLNKLKEFRSKLEFNDITPSFLADFEEHMRVTLGNEKGGSNNTLKMIRKFVYVAIKKDLTSNNAFKDFQIKEDSTGDIKFLTLVEFQKIKEYYKTLLSGHKHHLTLKSFIFSCCTGLRYGDGKKFKLNDINSNCILIKTQKTKKAVSIPLIPLAKEMLNYDLDAGLPNLKTPCVQTCNTALKEIAAVCKIDKPITTHYARHTFGCIALNNGISRETVQAIYGHSTSKQTDHYAILNNDTKVAEMEKLAAVMTL